MKIAVLGDSITEALPGSSYVDKLIEKHPDLEFKNMGVAGDTILSLHRRIKRKKFTKYDHLVLFIGVNDSNRHQSFKTKLANIIFRKQWSKDFETFMNRYRDLIKFLYPQCKSIIIIPPLLYGEDVNNKFNKELEEYERIINGVVRSYKEIKVLDTRSRFLDYLKDKEISEYLPIHVRDTAVDVATLHNNDEAIDKKSKSRGLHLMLDGIHINSIGANIIADSISEEIKIRINK